MVIDVVGMLTFTASVSFGAIVRELLGLYKGYNTYPEFRPEWKRIFLNTGALIFFGTFGVWILDELHVFNFGLPVVAGIAGLLGADTVRLITKRIGLGTKDLETVVSKQQMKNADMSDREVKALEYVKKYGKITNKIYQRLNQIGHDAAKKDLGSMAKLGKLTRVGYNRNTYYIFSGSKRPGHNGAFSGPSKRQSRSQSQKRPSEKLQLFKSRLETWKRNSQYSKLRR